MNAKKNLSSGSAVVRVSAISLLVNIALAAMKALAGLLAGSGALLSDALHSSADLLSNMIVILGARLSVRKPDREHPYGYERFECAAAVLLSMSLLITGLFIGMNALDHLCRKDSFTMPEPLALAVAAASIAVKEILFRYTWFQAERCDSTSLRADAWHHRSDALCSLGVFAGISGARMGFPKLDSIASLLICVLIAGAACKIFRDAVRKMVDHACSPETEEELRRFVAGLPEILQIESLRTREFGCRIYADMEICIGSQLSFADSWLVIQQTHDAVEKHFPQIKHITISAKPKADHEIL